jgi:hypothetical protein
MGFRPGVHFQRAGGSAQRKLLPNYELSILEENHHPAIFRLIQKLDTRKPESLSAAMARVSCEHMVRGLLCVMPDLWIVERAGMTDGEGPKFFT